MRKVGKKITMEECKRRALEFLASRQFGYLSNASQIAYYVWKDDPGLSRMRAQGAGLIGAKILRQLQNDDLVTWSHISIGKFQDCGYTITSTGREYLKANTL